MDTEGWKKTKVEQTKEKNIKQERESKSKQFNIEIYV